jgi:hypothetical protein
MYKMLFTNRLKMMYLFTAIVAWYQRFLQLRIHHPPGNSHNTLGYLAGKFTLYKRVSNTRLKIMYLFMAMMAWYQRCHRRRARIPFIHAVSSVCNTSTYTWTRGSQVYSTRPDNMYSMYKGSKCQNKSCTWSIIFEQLTPACTVINRLLPEKAEPESANV